MNVAFKKLTVAFALTNLVATGSLATATPAAAGWGWRHGGGLGLPRRRLGRSSRGGTLGALAVDAIAGAASQPNYYGGPYYLANRPVIDAWGNVVGYRPAKSATKWPEKAHRLGTTPAGRRGPRFRDLFGVGASRHCNRPRASL